MAEADVREGVMSVKTVEVQRRVDLSICRSDFVPTTFACPVNAILDRVQVLSFVELIRY